MKLFYVSSILVFALTATMSAQQGEEYYVNKVPIDSLNALYIEAEICNKPLSKMMYLSINYGQERRQISRQNERLTNSKGRFIEFNSNIDALNYLDKVGFEVVLPGVETAVSYTYILKRKANDSIRQ